MAPTAFPPHRTHHRERVSTESALGLLQTYLAQTETTPYLHPDARLAESGPHLMGEEDGGLALHHLRRVEAGLRGERLGDLVPQGVETTDDTNGAAEGSDKAWAQNGADPPPSEWEDMETYARAQSIAEGDLGGSDVRDRGIGQVPPLASRLASKDARKAGKKARRQEEKRQREAMRQRERAMEE
ncbi:MAG: hypothetical protein M1838_004496 [Thelocarpon superellum]|nr:MAG: hypothetical protein M1838_004496 [Thelocarpon superellum]